jgi:hypothetical protein
VVFFGQLLLFLEFSEVHRFGHISMARTRKLTLGKGAIVSCKGRLLRPSVVINRFFPLIHNTKRLENLVVLRKENRRRGKTTQTCLVVQSDEVMDGDNHIELYCNVRWFKIVIEGPPELFFVETDNTPIIHNDDFTENLPDEVTELFNLGRALSEDEIGNVMNTIPFDDDNKPAPENNPPKEGEVSVEEVAGVCTYAD